MKLHQLMVLTTLLCGSVALGPNALAGGKGGGESEFLGRVETLPGGGAVAGSWRVNVVTFLVDAATAIDQRNGRIAVGSLVEVRATKAADGFLHATKVQDEDIRREDFGEAEFAGVITALPNTAGFLGTWTVGGHPVTVTAATSLRTERGVIAVSAAVEIAGRVLSDGSVGATTIKGKTPGMSRKSRTATSPASSKPCPLVGPSGFGRSTGFPSPSPPPPASR